MVVQGVVHAIIVDRAGPEAPLDFVSDCGPQ